jgi:hypothetical protein
MLVEVRCGFAEVWFGRVFATLMFCVVVERPIGEYQIYDEAL